MSWRDLFERAGEREVSVEEVRAAVSKRREAGEEGTESDDRSDSEGGAES